MLYKNITASAVQQWKAINSWWDDDPEDLRQREIDLQLPFHQSYDVVLLEWDVLFIAIAFHVAIWSSNKSEPVQIFK